MGKQSETDGSSVNARTGDSTTSERQTKTWWYSRRANIAARSASRRDGIGVSALSDRAARVVTRVALAVRKRDVRRAEAGTTCDGTVARDAIDIGGRMADYTRERLW